jgi:hypothetical protein
VAGGEQQIPSTGSGQALDYELRSGSHSEESPAVDFNRTDISIEQVLAPLVVAASH